MGLSKSALTEDEENVLSFHPHWTTLINETLTLVLIAAVTGGLIWLAGMAGWSFAGTLQLIIAGIGAIAAFIWAIVPFLAWFTTRYILTNRRFVMRSGILSRSGRDIPLARVNDVSFHHNLIQRIFGTGTLVVESGGERGQLVLKNIPQVEHVQSELYRLIEELDDDEQK
jgi:uncharacterized membrane protein YdbT with pleckstrin-like domain